MDISLGEGDQTHALKRDGSTDTILDFRSIYFDINLTPEQETGSVDSTAKGTGTAVLNAAQDELEFSLTITGIDLDGHQTASKLDNMSAAHFHPGLPGVSGAPVFGFDGDESTIVNGPAGTIDGVWDASESLSGANLTNLLNDALYINIHTGSFPGGEISGQVLQQDEGNDRIDLRELNIGSMAQLKAITRTVDGSATISFFFDGVETQLVLNGLSELDLDKGSFLFARKANTIHGTDNQDDLFASSRGSHVFGFDGKDRLLGGNGDDALTGGFGSDRMTGGKGQDYLDGIDGKDRYVFKSVTDSSASALTADQIVTFVNGGDRLDLKGIDGSESIAGNQVLDFIGTDAFTAEGQVRQFIDGDYAFIEINTSGAAGAEMMIRVQGTGVLETDIIL